MKKVLLFFGIVFVYIPLHFVVAHNFTWYRSEVPDILANQIANACINASQNSRNRQQSRAIIFACDCIGSEIQERYYLEEYLLVAGRIFYAKVDGSGDSQARIGGAKLADVQNFCVEEAKYQFSD